MAKVSLFNVFDDILFYMLFLDVYIIDLLQLVLEQLAAGHGAAGISGSVSQGVRNIFFWGMKLESSYRSGGINLVSCSLNWIICDFAICVLMVLFVILDRLNILKHNEQVWGGTGTLVFLVGVAAQCVQGQEMTTTSGTFQPSGHHNHLYFFSLWVQQKSRHNMTQPISWHAFFLNTDIHCFFYCHVTSCQRMPSWILLRSVLTL